MVLEKLTFHFLNLNLLKLIVIGEACIGNSYHCGHQFIVFSFLLVLLLFSIIIVIFYYYYCFLFRIKSVECRWNTTCLKRENIFCSVVSRDTHRCTHECVSLEYIAIWGLKKKWLSELGFKHSWDTCHGKVPIISCFKQWMVLTEQQHSLFWSAICKMYRKTIQTVILGQLTSLCRSLSVL